LALDFRRMEEVGDCVLVHVHASGTGVGSGATVEEDWFQLYSFRDGAIATVRAFDLRDDAVAAAQSSKG
jgi:ketosteroid isomerase-like protein